MSQECAILGRRRSLDQFSEDVFEEGSEAMPALPIARTFIPGQDRAFLFRRPMVVQEPQTIGVMNLLHAVVLGRSQSSDQFRLRRPLQQVFTLEGCQKDGQLAVD